MNHPTYITGNYHREWANRPLLPLDENVIFYILDRTLSISHDDFSDASIVDLGVQPDIQNAHGTSMASLIVGKKYGMCPNNPLYFLSCVNPEDVMPSLNTILEHKMDRPDARAVLLCNFEVGFSVDDFFSALKGLNTSIVVPCGNGANGDEWVYPATSKYVTVAGSHDSGGKVSLFNRLTFNQIPDIFALGADVSVADLSDDGYGKISGTCAAAAIVAASIAYYASEEDLVKFAKKNTLTWRNFDYKNSVTNTCYVGEQEDYTLELEYFNTFNDYVSLRPHMENEDEVMCYMNLVDGTDVGFKQACMDAVQSVDAPNIKVPMSGGVDSEVVARTCIETKTKFTPVIMRYWYEDDVVNYHDIKYAIDFCEIHKLEVEYVDIDIYDFFFSGKFYEYGKEYNSSSPQLCLHLHMMDLVDGFFIFPGDAAGFYGKKVSIQPMMYFCYDFYMSKNNRAGIPRLFTHTADTVCSSVSSPLANKLDSYEHKVEFFRHAGYDVAPREKKYTGFEVFRDALNEKYRTLRYFDTNFRVCLQQFCRGMELIYDD